MAPGQGTYVRYDHELIGDVLCAEAARAHALAIGEDLGTVEPWLRDFLADRRVLGTSMLWFERRQDGTPRPPGEWRRGCLATVGTHDMPPAAMFLTGEQVSIRAELGLLTEPEADERAAARAELDGWLAMLGREGLLGGEGSLGRDGLLGRTGLPGTVNEYPNWRIPLTDGDGEPVLLEDLAARDGVRAVAQAVSGGLRPAAEKIRR